jgi:type IV secretion system protein VirB6
MAGSFTAYADLQSRLLEPFAHNLDAVVGTVSGKIGPAFAAAMTLYVIWEGYNITLGHRHHEFASDFIRKLMKLGLIAAFVLNADLYRSHVVEPAVNLGPDMVSQLVTSTRVPDANAFDALANDVAASLARAWKGTSWSAPAGMARVAVWSLILMVVAFVAITGAFIYVMMIKAAVYMVLLLGPAFIAGLLFESTAQFFRNFFSTLVTLGIHQVLISSFMGLLVTAAKRQSGDDKELYGIVATFFFMLMVMPGIILVAQALGRGATWSGQARFSGGASRSAFGWDAAGMPTVGGGTQSDPPDNSRAGSRPPHRVGDHIGGSAVHGHTRAAPVEPLIAPRPLTSNGTTAGISEGTHAEGRTPIERERVNAVPASALPATGSGTSGVARSTTSTARGSMMTDHTDFSQAIDSPSGSDAGTGLDRQIAHPADAPRRGGDTAGVPATASQSSRAAATTPPPALEARQATATAAAAGFASSPVTVVTGDRPMPPHASLL